MPAERSWNFWRAAALLGLIVLSGLPLALPVFELVIQTRGWEAWTEVGRLLGLAQNTACLTAGVLVLALPAGVAGAVLLYRTDLPGRGIFRGLVVLALFVP